MQSVCLSTNKLRPVIFAIQQFATNETEILISKFGMNPAEHDQNRIVIERNFNEIIARRYYSRVLVSLLHIIKDLSEKHQILGIIIKSPIIKYTQGIRERIVEIRMMRVDFSMNQVIYEFLSAEMVRMAQKIMSIRIQEKNMIQKIFYCDEINRIKKVV